MYWVIEQLFEDLNSYCESFVALPEAPHTKYVSEVLKGTNDQSSSKQPFVISSPIYNAMNTQEGKGTSGKVQGNLTVDCESLRDAMEQSKQFPSSPPPLTIGEPSIPTELVRPGNRRASTEHQSLQAALSKANASPPFTKNSENKEDRGTQASRKSSGSSMLSSPGSRPGLGRSKTLAALAVSETTVNALPGKTNLGASTNKEALEPSSPYSASMSRQLSSESSATTVLGDAELSSSPHREEEEKERIGLSESILSLRAVGNPTSPFHSERGGDSIGAVPPAAMLAPGKREPPHGLGRTVRDAINLKLFPTYPNPKDINDWDVPVTLLDLRKRVTGNWDLTMCKVLPFVDGINHVKRIAQLANADLELTRQCMEHLLYYRCIITMDTFQFTNMYTVRPSIAVMAEDEVIMVECASYVTKPGHVLPTWPKLLHLYSSLRPALTVNDWMEENDVEDVGIDVRRFVSFGVIKGFLRRIHRYPLLLQDGASPLPEAADLRRDKTISSVMRGESNSRSRERGREGDSLVVRQIPLSPELGTDVFSSQRGRHGPRQASENESLKTGGTANSIVSANSIGRRRLTDHQAHRKTRATVMDVANVALEAAAAAKEQANQPRANRVSIRAPLSRGGSSSTVRPVNNLAGSKDSDEQLFLAGMRAGRSNHVQIPPGFVNLLDGTHPDDEFCVQFGLSWNEVLAILILIGKQPSMITGSRQQASTIRTSRLNEQEEEVETTLASTAAAAASSGWGPIGTSVAGDVDESGVANMSSFGMANSRRRSTAFSLSKSRNPPGQSDFSRYASTGDGVSAWGRISGIQSSSLSVEDHNQLNRESVAKGDLGRVKIIIK